MICIYCGSHHTQKNGNHNGLQIYRCIDCNKRFDAGKYEENYFFHFNTKLKKTDRNVLTRENYCIPTNKINSAEKKFIKRINERYKDKQVKFYQCYLKFPNAIFADEEHYSDEWVEKHYKDCMKNFDLNMKYFKSLDYDDFDKKLKLFVKKNRFVEANNLNDLVVSGIYMLVLDKYKQVYIGISDNIRKRILNHWSKKKDFDRLIFGKVEESILSIDSFGALDTTRIFYKKVNTFFDIFSSEEKYVKNFDNKYLLNRVGGGINAEDDEKLRNLELIASRKKRELK